MKLERTKNATRNLIFGVFLKVYQILIPFVMRTAIIYLLGVQYLGLSSLFTSLLQVLNLAELGVGSAMVYSMYKPIVDDDTSKICALIKLYRLYYRVIGLVIAIVGICLTPFIPKLVSGDVPADINLYVLYLLNLAATVLSYWLFAYKNALFEAHQRIDVISKVTLITNTIQYGLQFLVLYLFKSYYLYVIVMLFTQVLTNIITAQQANQFYPKYKCIGSIDKKEIHLINTRIKDLFTSKIGAVIINSADTIVISSFLGLSMLAIYQNYFFILKAVLSIVTVIFSACTAGIGNSVIVETEEKNFNDLKKFTFLIVWISGFCACCLLCLYQPFMQIWVGKKLMLDFTAIICFCVYYFIYEINQLLNTYKDAAGIWHEDRFRPLVTALSNLAMNLIMVQFLGIYGILLSTVLSMLFIGMPWILHNLFTTIFSKKYLKGYLEKLIYYVVVCAITFIVSGSICHFINFNNLWLTIIIRGVVCCIVPNIIFLLVYYKSPEFKESMILVDKMTKGKLKLSNKFK